MPATGAPEAVAFTVTTNFGAGAIPTSGAGVTALPRHQLMPAVYDGETVSYRLDHGIELEYQVGHGVYDADTNTISRPTGAAILLSSAGAGVNETFSPGLKRVLIVPTGADLESLLAELDSLTATHQGVTAAAAQAGYTITRTSALVLVELTQDMNFPGTFALPASPQSGDVVRVIRHGGGEGLWSRIGGDSSDVLRGRDDLIEYQWVGAAWTRVLQREQGVLRVNAATYAVSGGDHLLDLVFHSTPCTVRLPNDLGTRTRFRLVQEGAAVVTAVLASGVLSTPQTSPPLATTGDGTALAATVIGNETGTAARYRLVLEGAAADGGGTAVVVDGGTFQPTAVDLSSSKNYDPFTQSGALAFALAAVTEVNGAWVSVEVTGDDTAITYSADFAAVDGSDLTGEPYSGFTGSRRLMIMWDAPTGKALVALSEAAGVEADSAAEAPILITGDTSLVAATHHGKTLEISAATSPRITCAQIGAGVEVRIHRPINQPSPILVPPAAQSVWLGGGSQMGMNRIVPDGIAEIHYSNGNLPKTTGDLMWGGRPTTADWAGTRDLVELRRGEGLSATSVGNPVSSWTSTVHGVADDVYANAIDGAQPHLGIDGGIVVKPNATKRWLGGSRTSFAGNVLAIALAWKHILYTSGEPRIVSLQQDEGNRILVAILSANFMRIRLQTSTGFSLPSFGFHSDQQYRVAAIVIDRAAGIVTWLTNSRLGGGDTSLASTQTLAHFPDWTAWALSGERHSIGDVNGSAVAEYELYGVSIIDNLNTAVTATVVDRDLLIRLLGWARLQLPPGVEG